MAKTAQQKLNEFYDECDLTRSVIKDFSNKSFEEKGSYAWAAGFFESVLVDAIMHLPKNKREEFRKRLVV